ncbi:HAMP domain-containing histidine kinase [Candidatus Gottesmanbacteria bacterium]|nr:HAMP domain-containing histidine kinase [Candidatus Gottesmanbacteria bacterium]
MKLLLIGTLLGGIFFSYNLLKVSLHIFQGAQLSIIHILSLLVGLNIIIICWYILRKRDEELELANNLKEVRTKEDFIAFAAHQLRNPITHIRWETEGLLKKKNLGKDIKRVLDDIGTESKRLAELTDVLLNISTFGALRQLPAIQKSNIINLTKQVVTELRPEISAKQLSFRTKYGSGQVFMPMEENVFKIVVKNLLENAVKYSKTGGILEVAILDDPKEVEIKVKDTGIGIPVKEIDKIFAKLFRASNAKSFAPSGHGLGLYLVKAIIDAMNGKIKVSSTVDKGTEFSVLLPRNIT